MEFLKNPGSDLIFNIISLFSKHLIQDVIFGILSPLLRTKKTISQTQEAVRTTFHSLSKAKHLNALTSSSLPSSVEW